MIGTLIYSQLRVKLSPTLVRINLSVINSSRNPLVTAPYVTILTSNPDRVNLKSYKIGICCFPGKHAALSRKSKGWFTRNQDNVSEW